MNLTVNNSMNNRPNFGMAVLLDKSAEPIIKNQVLGLSKKAYSKFVNKLDGVIERQAGNPNNIVVKGSKNGKGLMAEVIDSNADTAIKNYVTAQGMFQRNGSLKFLQTAEEKADRLKSINERLSTVTKHEPIIEPSGYEPMESIH